jgi:hypothetical protein
MLPRSFAIMIGFAISLVMVLFSFFFIIKFGETIKYNTNYKLSSYFPNLVSRVLVNSQCHKAWLLVLNVNIDPQDEKFKLFVLLGVSWWPSAKLPNTYLRRLRGKATKCFKDISWSYRKFVAVAMILKFNHTGNDDSSFLWSISHFYLSTFYLFFSCSNFYCSKNWKL